MPADTNALKTLPPIEELGDLDDLEPQVPLDAPQDATTDETTDPQAYQQTEITESRSENDGETGSAEHSEDEPDEESAESADELTEELTRSQQDALAWRNLQENFGRDPKGFIATLTGSLPQAQAQAILAVLNEPAGATQPDTRQAAITFQADDVLTPEELFVKRHADAIQSVPVFKQEVQNFAQQAGQILQSHAAHLDQVLLENAALSAKLDAVLAHTGLKLPEMDETKVRNVLARGKSHREAVAAVYAPNAKRAVTTTAARVQVLPTTPQNTANGGTSPDSPKSGDSFVNLFREVAASVRR